MSRKHKSEQTALVDIITVTGGRFDLLSKCLEAVKRNTSIPYNQIIIDNASLTEEKKLWSHLFTDVRTKRLEIEVGFPVTNNEGARMGKAPLILLLSDDIEVTDGCIDKMVATMDNPQYGVVGAKLLFPEDSSSPIRPAGKVQHIGHALDIKAQVIHPLVGWGKDHPKTRISREVFSVTGACFMTRRNLWSKVGGLDAVYGAGTYEDVDYCLKVRRLGGKIYINTDAVAYHYTGATAEKRKTVFPMQINHMIFLSRWSNSGLLSWDDWTYY